MTPRPLVGITGRRRAGSAIGVPGGFADAPLDVYFADYATSVADAGGIPVFVPLDVDLAALMTRLDGLLVAGGEDVDPSRYGAERIPETGPSDALRDELELGAVRAATSSGVPVLGICRGHQVINVAFGGTLIQHLVEHPVQHPVHGDPGTRGENHMPTEAHRRDRTHEVLLEPGSTVARLYGPRIAVNSFHHQAVDRPGEEIRVTGRSIGGVVEAIEHAERPVLGVQWHPEAFGGDPVFDWLIDSARDAAEARRNET